MAELKRLDFKTGAFTANGVNYQVEANLGVERYAELQILQLEMGFAVTFKDLYGKMEKAYSLLNKQRLADTVVLINDVMRGMVKAHEKQPTILKICALFINAENEDRSVFNQDMADKKILDWTKEGIDIRDFFHVASSSVNGFLEIYKTVTLNISGRESEQYQQAEK